MAVTSTAMTRRGRFLRRLGITPAGPYRPAAGLAEIEQLLADALEIDATTDIPVAHAHRNQAHVNSVPVGQDEVAGIISPSLTAMGRAGSYGRFRRKARGWCTTAGHRGYVWQRSESPAWQPQIRQHSVRASPIVPLRRVVAFSNQLGAANKGVLGLAAWPTKKVEEVLASPRCGNNHRPKILGRSSIVSLTHYLLKRLSALIMG